MLTDNWRKTEYIEAAIVRNHQLKDWSSEIKASCKFGNWEALHLFIQLQASSPYEYKLAL